MTSEEIRDYRPYGNDEKLECSLLREIAAQLAEQNEQMREDRKLRSVILDEERAERQKRDELLTKSSAGIGDVVKAMQAPPVIPPRVVFPGEVVHLGCLIREPDGRHAIANEMGLTRLEPDEAARLLALIAPKSEGKPS